MRHLTVLTRTAQTQKFYGVVSVSFDADRSDLLCIWRQNAEGYPDVLSSTPWANVAGLQWSE